MIDKKKGRGKQIFQKIHLKVFQNSTDGNANIYHLIKYN
jgi:hypothetical protein